MFSARSWNLGDQYGIGEFLRAASCVLFFVFGFSDGQAVLLTAGMNETWLLILSIVFDKSRVDSAFTDARLGMLCRERSGGSALFE